MFMRTTYEVREDMGPLVVTVMCSTPSKDPFTLIVHTSDGSAVGEQMSVLCQSCLYASRIAWVCMYHAAHMSVAD